MSERLGRLAEIPVTELKGVAKRKAQALEVLEITSLLDLVMYYPRRWSDRTAMSTIAQLVEGVDASVHGRVVSSSARRLRGGKVMVQAVLVDAGGGGGAGAASGRSPRLSVVFFNQPWRAGQLGEDVEVVVHGRPTAYRGGLQMASPQLDVVPAAQVAQGELSQATLPSPELSSPELCAPVPKTGRHTGRIVPIYPLSERSGLASYEIENYVTAALEVADSESAFVDPLSVQRCAELGLVSRSKAFHDIHAPSSWVDRDAARRRLAFDELWRLQVALVMSKRAAMAASRGISHAASGNLVDRFIASLPFALTDAQRRAIDEIVIDLVRPYPMHRLLQGDVGAGKTVVAVASLLVAVQGGYQGALMVPTEVLAEQHHVSVNRLLTELTVADEGRLDGRRLVTVELLTSRTGSAERERIVTGLASGTVDVLVGTQALLTDDVQFGALGLVVVDEQHRFGVDQRAALRDKGASHHDPDVLVMTATPIPRTAAMTVYGDLDVTELSELPPGRTPIQTRWIDDEESEVQMWEHVRAEVAKGHRAYVVCPLVHPGGQQENADGAQVVDAEGSQAALPGMSGSGAAAGAQAEAADAARVLRAATEEVERLGGAELVGCRLGLLHGQMRAVDKERVMAEFRDGAIDVLVATTVIEVGVDVASATVIVVEDADRFGIAQLHQLRGRVGRGKLASSCYLLAPASEETPAAMRLRALERTTDGFELAEVDLELRGEGTVLGIRQNGRNELRLASLRTDRELIVRARSLAESVLDRDPDLSEHPRFAEELRLFVRDGDAAYLFKS